MVAFYGAMRAIKLYPLENAAVVKALDDLTTATRALIAEEEEPEFRTSGEFILSSTRPDCVSISTTTRVSAIS